MATTTNYGWTTPDDTALVKDGAAAIRTLGTSVDTTTKNLNPSTTLGDIEYRSSTSNTNTRLAIGTSGQALTVVAGVPSWAASATSVLTTTGDVLYASSANTLARLGIGTTGQYLKVVGGVPAWATLAATAPTSGVARSNSSESTSSSTYTGLTTATAITITTGTKALVSITSYFYSGSTNNLIRTSFAISGATTRAADDEVALVNFMPTLDDTLRATATTLITGLTAGSNTFTMQFKNTSGKSATYTYREISVIDMGS